MAALIPQGKLQFTDANGSPLVGGSLTYAQPGTGGATLRPIYGDEAETVPLSNPLPLDAGGWPYSGGSQQVIWGFGQYEIFARNASGATIWTAIVDTPGGLSGGTINGSVQINGDLSVVGNITDTLSLATPLANVTQLNAGNVNVSGNMDAAGLLYGGGLITSGDVDASGTVNANEVNANNTNFQYLNFHGATAWGTTNFNDYPIIGVSSLNGGFPKMLGGQGETDSTGHVFVPMSPAFQFVASIVVSLIGGPALGDIGPVTISVNNGANGSGFDVYSELANVSSGSGSGTGSGNGEGGNGGGPGSGGDPGGGGLAARVGPTPRSTGISMIFNWIAIGF